jgi:exosome complex RNA-binding protein Rrp4
MLMLIKDYVGGDLMVGNNGMVWISERSDMPLALKAIKLIEKKAHKSGLTDEVAAMLKAERGARPQPEAGGEAESEGGERMENEGGKRTEGERYV